MMEESRRIGESVHKILELDGVVSGGLVLKLYEDLFDPNTSNSNFLQGLYYFLGRGKRIGYLTEDYDLYIDGDMVYNYYTPQQAELFNSVKVDILARYQTAKIKTEKEETVPLKDYHKLEKEVSYLMRAKKLLERRNKGIQRKNFALVIALLSLTIVVFFSTLYFNNKINTLSKDKEQVTLVNSQSSKVDDLFTDKSRNSVKEGITKEDVLALKDTISKSDYSEEVKSKDLVTLDSLVSYFDIRDKIIKLSENSSPLADYLGVREDILSFTDSSVRSILYNSLIDLLKDKIIYDSIIAKLNEYPSEDEAYQRIESQINSMSPLSSKLKESALDYLKEVRESVIPQSVPEEE